MKPRSRAIVVVAALSGLVAVAAGAFGAHGASSEQARDWLQTGGQYQGLHAVAALAAVSFASQLGRGAGLAAWLFLVGGMVFGGTLYLMAFGAPRILGAVTPLGGLLLMVGWIVLASSALRARSGPTAG